jgi:ubiquinone/menaquinone biosynthesis C-methylase UbiE
MQADRCYVVSMVFSTQSDVFKSGEGDAWYSRNAPLMSDHPTFIEQKLAGYVKPNSSVLEIGCSSGARLQALSTLATPKRICGTDPSSAAIHDGLARGPGFDLRVGVAENLPFDEQFDLVILGFFLYLVDRDSLPNVVAEVNRVTNTGSTVAVIDFDPPHPLSRPYVHTPGVTTYKYDYPSLFTAFPTYVLAEKVSFSHNGENWVDDPQERVALTILKRVSGT